MESIYYMDTNRALADGWVRDGSTAGNNLYTDRLFDNNPNSGWGIGVNGDFRNSASEPKAIVLAAWFAEPQTVDYISMLLDIRNFTNGDYFVEAVLVDAYTPGDPPTLGNQIPLDGHIAYRQYDGTHNSGKPGRHWVGNLPSAPGPTREQNWR